MRSSRVVRASDCPCRSRISPRFDPSILRHSGIWGAADEAMCRRKKIRKIPLFNWPVNGMKNEFYADSKTVENVAKRFTQKTLSTGKLIICSFSNFIVIRFVGLWIFWGKHCYSPCTRIQISIKFWNPSLNFYYIFSYFLGLISYFESKRVLNSLKMKTAFLQMCLRFKIGSYYQYSQYSILNFLKERQKQCTILYTYLIWKPVSELIDPLRELKGSLKGQ